ncbi:hypothetical protein BV898_04881 [Hypsibius exemplaris]|uniref:Uncharacterized protein n=1 Tax=Hypsibius exemplaris TaxID=2072580 RepID=A0A1W0X0U2_HYPEX|nr:hypothetical protein BV898_04881 [Hypsibius exemplaris]
MDLITANVITLLAMLSSCFLASLLPSLIHIHADPNSRKKGLLPLLSGTATAFRVEFLQEHSSPSFIHTSSAAFPASLLLTRSGCTRCSSVQL